MFAFTAVKGQSSSFLWQILTIPFSWKHDDMWPTALKTFRSLCSTGGVRLGRNSCRRLTFSRTSTSLCSPPGVGRPGIWLKQDYARVSSKLTIHSFFNSRLILKDVWNPYYGLDMLGQGCTNCGSLAAGLRGNGERMRKWGGNGEKMRKWREIDSLHFLILSLFPPSFSISSLSFHFLHQNASHFVAKC